MIKCFANCYWDQNKDRMLQSSPLWTEVMILDLAWMILALNTKNHSSQVAQQYKFTKHDFIQSTLECLKNIVSKEFVADLYDRIMRNKLESKIDCEELFYRKQRPAAASNFIEDEMKRNKMFQEEGTDFIKYGRQGSPHRRIVKINQEETQIQWKGKN